MAEQIQEPGPTISTEWDHTLRGYASNATLTWDGAEKLRQCVDRVLDVPYLGGPDDSWGEGFRAALDYVRTVYRDALGARMPPELPAAGEAPHVQ